MSTTLGSFRKSSFCPLHGSKDCVEAGTGPGAVAVRDTRQEAMGGARTVLQVSPGAWQAFLARVR